MMLAVREGDATLFSRLCDLLFANEQVKRLRLDIGTVNLIVLYNSPFTHILRFWLYSKRHQCKLVLDNTEWYGSLGMNPFFSILKNIDTYIRIRIFPAICDGVFTTSKYLTEIYSDSGIVVLELPSLFDSDEFVFLRNSSNMSPRILYCGHPFVFDRAKRNSASVKERLDRIILGLYSVRRLSFSFDLIGVTKAEYLSVYPNHKKLLEKLGNRVKFHGRQENSAVKQMLHSVDFQVFFRDRNRTTNAGFPTKLSESVSAGVIVITSKLVGVEKYSELPFLFLVEKGCEVEVLTECLSFSRYKIDSLKREAFESRIFHYEKYQARLKEFLFKIGLFDSQR